MQTGPNTAAIAPASYTKLAEQARQIASLNAIASLIGWDQETYMPSQGAEGRAEQHSVLAGILHEKRTSPQFLEHLEACEADAQHLPGSIEHANLRELRRDLDLATKLPTALVSAIAKATSLAQESWKQARADSDFDSFAPHLAEVITLTRRKAECYGIPAIAGRKGELYDALLNEYEPGASAAEIDAVFKPLQVRLSALVAELCSAPRQLSTQATEIGAPVPAQQAFGIEVLTAIGFDLTAGRLDQTAHPFCSGMGPGDTRLTTRYTGSSFLEPLSSTMHEAGHGLYEQGLPKVAHFGMPISDATSLGIHESQSRMWENFIGRSREFCTWLLPVAKRHFGPSVASLTEQQLFESANTVRRSFIRVESDEATYNLHVMLRFGLERDLISGRLAIADLPAEWNRRFKELFGLDVPDAAHGCLQDVHWSFGLVGYFPTYTLGNLYAAQIWEAINKQIPDMPSRISRGDFAPLLAFLRANIHQHGRRYSAGELCQRITGQPLSSEPLLRYLSGKLRPLHGL